MSPAVTIVLSTHNRSKLLGPAIDSLLEQADAPPYDIVIVDNNSSDETRAIVASRIASGRNPLRYVFEARQGLAYGRNAGIAAAQADLIAFTDDDVRVSEGWVGAIRRAFDAHPDVDCLGGRTLPVWPSTPPHWLTPLHWVGPLALQDYGDRPFIVDARRPLCLAGANFAFRKVVFDRIGRFSPEFPRCEDSELMLRLWMSGARALYVPEMVVHAAVQPERLEKTYHRRWHSNIGRCNARMGLAELTRADGTLRTEVPGMTRLFGVPLFAIRQVAVHTWRWLRHLVRRRPSEAFWHENQVREILGYIRECAAFPARWNAAAATSGGRCARSTKRISS
jgi:glycosyltransferase involved in cell wall biosynthesis